MEVAADRAAETRPTKKRNWWKIGFFVTLVAFELAREWAVVASFEYSQPNASGFVWSGGGLTSAEGTWQRIDNGDKLVPAAVRIECWQPRGTCIESSVTIDGQYVAAPSIAVNEARFTPDAVTYENDSSLCSTYRTRIDLGLKKAFQVRDSKGSKERACQVMERRMEMQLAQSYGTVPRPFEGHFVPLLNGIGFLLTLID